MFCQIVGNRLDGRDNDQPNADEKGNAHARRLFQGTKRRGQEAENLHHWGRHTGDEARRHASKPR
jgi:hypothetical protein